MLSLLCFLIFIDLLSLATRNAIELVASSDAVQQYHLSQLFSSDTKYTEIRNVHHI